MKSKNLLLTFITFLSLSTLSAQNETAQSTNNARFMFQGGNATASVTGTPLHFFNPARAVEGTIYLFDSWENSAVIHTTTNEKFLLRNINLNINRNMFESKIGNDSIYSFFFNNIEKFVINNRTFKNYYWDSDNRVYEVIAEGGDVEILKGFAIRFVEGSPNPMLNRYKDKYVTDEKYFVRKNDKIAKIRLKKSSIMKMLDLDKDKEAKVLDFAKNRKLSFNKEMDLKSIIYFAKQVI